MIRRQVDEWGRVLFNSDDAIELLFQGHDISKLLFEPSTEIDAYNEVCHQFDKNAHALVTPEQPTETPEQDAERRQSQWWIPVEYAELDVKQRLLDLCGSQEELDRVNLEMRMFEERDLLPVLRLMCFLVDRWRENGVVWGVGRGSSVASYCLFLIGVHKIDSIAFNLSIHEFLK